MLGICVGASGVDREQDKEMMQRHLSSVLPAVPTSIHNDAVVALARFMSHIIHYNESRQSYFQRHTG